MILFVLIFYTIAVCYFHSQFKKVEDNYSIFWNGKKYIVRDNKGRIKLQAKGKFNGLFDIIVLGETL